MFWNKKCFYTLINSKSVSLQRPKIDRDFVTPIDFLKKIKKFFFEINEEENKIK